MKELKLHPLDGLLLDALDFSLVDERAEVRAKGLLHRLDRDSEEPAAQAMGSGTKLIFDNFWRQ